MYFKTHAERAICPHTRARIESRDSFFVPFDILSLLLSRRLPYSSRSSVPRLLLWCCAIVRFSTLSVPYRTHYHIHIIASVYPEKVRVLSVAFLFFSFSRTSCSFFVYQSIRVERNALWLIMLLVFKLLNYFVDYGYSNKVKFIRWFIREL